MKLTKYKLGDIAEIFAGGDAPKGHMSLTKTERYAIPIYSNGVDKEGLYGYTDIARVTKKAVTISARGTIGVAFRRNEAYFPIVRLISVIPNTDIADLDYLYYRLCYIPIKGDGSVQSQLTVPMAMEYEIDLPDLATQRKVASILSSLDRKIVLNRQINTNLEALARQLYDYWFVQFDFPDVNGKPYKSSGGKMVYNEKLKREIPQEWEVKPISEILGKIPTTYKLSTKEYQDIGKYPVIDQTTGEYIVGFSDRDDAVVHIRPVVVFGDHSCAVKYVNFDFCRGADGTQILNPNDERISTEYLYFATKDVRFRSGYARHFSILKDSLIIVPDKETAKQYRIQGRKLFELIGANIAEITSLTRQRDELLPLLMNGQVTIK